MACQCCLHPTADTAEYKDGRPQKTAKLCKICAESVIGRLHFFVNEFPDARVLQAIAFVGNEIIANINKLDKPK